eukprot:TRINITY_DN7852_c0_g1_i2.p1 TRINITY_DN7852_c0_g1~~TRINITY_DN7852_c0_g1_i2.p1  ORF type:complete len:206 (-),score=24.40 TRINITY_DN7852_c0_g1_i2:159-776(-)
MGKPYGNSETCSPIAEISSISTSSVGLFSTDAACYEIGHFKTVTDRAGDIIFSCDNLKKLIQFEINTKFGVYLITVPYENIEAIGHIFRHDGSGVLILNLRSPPLFSQNILMTNNRMAWVPCEDFTGQQILLFKCHYIHFPSRILKKVLGQIVRHPLLNNLVRSGLPENMNLYYEEEFYDKFVAMDPDLQFGISVAACERYFGLL